jgi:Protein of unknown function (DUF3349)
MTLRPFLAKVISWLRAGYPDGVPAQDYVPLLTVLRHQLSEDEVTLIADELAFSPDPSSAEEIKRATGAISRTPVSDADIARVRSRLAAGGWPLEPDPD